MDQFEGPAGKAWVHNFPHEKPDHQASVQAWILHAPNAHPAWSHYVLNLIHLRPIEGVKNAKKYHEDATHEVIVFALDPDKPITDGQHVTVLNPPNYMEQFRADNDAAALEYVEGVIKEIVVGTLSPDTDHRSAWHQRFPYRNPGRH